MIQKNPANPSPPQIHISLEVPIDRILIAGDRRPADTATIAELVMSLRVTGQINPIILRPISGDPAHDFTLVAGQNRLLACREAGLATVLARILVLDDERARILQIDENLIGDPLSDAETDIALAELRAIYDRTHNDRARSAHAANRVMGRAHDAGDILSPTFAEQLASTTGYSKRQIQRSNARAAEIGVNQLKTLVNTSLDRSGELEALARLKPDNRATLIKRAIAGENVSARRLMKVSAPKIRSGLDRLQAAWDASTVLERKQFCDRNNLTQANK